MSGNWLLYIWAVNAGYLLQASLGYYINPLVNVLLGVVFLKERLRRPQAIAVLLALAAVIFRTFSFGQFPWIALTLGFSFRGLRSDPQGGARRLPRRPDRRDDAADGPWQRPTSSTSKPRGRVRSSTPGRSLDALLVGTGVFTAVPLLFFNLGARRINLSTVGLLQYIAPSCMFLMAVLRLRRAVHGTPARSPSP